MSLVMIESSKLSAFAFSSDIASGPAGVLAVAGLTQQHVQYHSNLGNRQGWGIFFFPTCFQKANSTPKCDT